MEEIDKIQSTDDTPAEPSFTWRRMYVFVSLALAYVLVWRVVGKVTDPTTLKWIVYSLLGVHVIGLSYWACGASMSDFIRLTKAWRGKSGA